MSSNENDNYSSNEFPKHLKLDKVFLQQIDIDSIKQKFPQLYVQLHRKMNNFLDQYIDLLRDKVTNLKQYEIIQEFYKQMSAYIQYHSSIKSYQNTSSSADTSTSSVHSISSEFCIFVLSWNDSDTVLGLWGQLRSIEVKMGQLGSICKSKYLPGIKELSSYNPSIQYRHKFVMVSKSRLG